MTFGLVCKASPASSWAVEKSLACQKSCRWYCEITIRVDIVCPICPIVRLSWGHLVPSCLFCFCFEWSSMSSDNFLHTKTLWRKREGCRPSCCLRRCVRWHRDGTTMWAESRIWGAPGVHTWWPYTRIARSHISQSYIFVQSPLCRFMCNLQPFQLISYVYYEDESTKKKDAAVLLLLIQLNELN